MFLCPLANITSVNSSGAKLFQNLYRVYFSVAIQVKTLNDPCVRFLSLVAFQSFLPVIRQGQNAGFCAHSLVAREDYDPLVFVPWINDFCQDPNCVCSVYVARLLGDKAAEKKTFF